MKIRTALICLVLLCSITLTGYGAEFNRIYVDMTGFETVRQGLAPVRIALIDTGVDTTRVDAKRILQGKSYVSDSTKDTIGHGTHITSLIIGYDDGENFLPDLAPNATIVPLVYQTKGADGIRKNGGVEALCQGIYDAVDVYGAQVIVISSGLKVDYETLRNAVAYAEEKGVIFISAAGNTGSEIVYYPAGYDTVVAVGAVDVNKNPATFSQKNGVVTVVAPGKDLLAASIAEEGGFDKVSGTSYACAYVAAMAAQLKGAYPDMTPAQFRHALELTSTDLMAEGYDIETGYGLIHYERAISQMTHIAELPLFADVESRDWFFEAVSFVSRKGLMSGVTATVFAPNQPVTRAMLVTILHRAEGAPIDGNAAVFSDVRTGSYYENAVGWAKEHGIISGVTETRFAPNESVTREQIAAIMHRYARYKGYDVSVGENTNILSYEDFFDISEYAVSAMQYAAGSGLMGGKTESTLAPKDNATRAEIATILKRFLEMK